MLIVNTATLYEQRLVRFQNSKEEDIHILSQDLD